MFLRHAPRLALFVNEGPGEIEKSGDGEGLRVAAERP